MVNMVKSCKEIVDACDFTILNDTFMCLTKMANEFGTFYGRKGRNQILKTVKKAYKTLSNDDPSACCKLIRAAMKTVLEVTDDKGRYVLKEALEMRLAGKADFDETVAWILRQYGRNEFGEKIR